MTGMLRPEEVEETVGTVEVRQTFRASRVGTIAGCYVTDGHITRGAKVRIVRDGTSSTTGTIASLKRFNDDVRDVAAGYECGIVLANYQDVKEGDVFEVLRDAAGRASAFVDLPGSSSPPALAAPRAPGHRGRMACPPREVERRSSHVRTG